MIKVTKKIMQPVFIAGCICLGFILGACAKTITAEENKGFRFNIKATNNELSAYTLVDEEADVEYIVIESYSNISGSVSVAITPRIDPNGHTYNIKRGQ